jgi:aminoglycoside 6'-N-acetyltransferase I
MQIEDINRLSEIYREIFISEEWGYNWLTHEKTVTYLTDMFNAPKFVGYVLIIGGELVGGCFGDVGDYYKSVQYYIKELFIELALQKKGTGSWFLAEVEVELKKLDIDNITLNTSRNIPAYKFYHRNGYMDSPESVFMVKFLNAEGH